MLNAPLSRFLFCLLLLTTSGSIAQADELSWLDSYQVRWDSPSPHAAASMPCGGGDTGLNVWVEKGDLFCYVQRSGAFDENNQYLKLGRLRVRLTPNPFVDGTTFRQELILRHGHVAITGEKDGLRTTVQVWVDVFHPAVHVEIEANQPIHATASYENWRVEDRDLPDDVARPRFACLGWDGYPGKVTRFRDEIAFAGNNVYFFHRNRDDKLLIDYTIRQQGLNSVRDQIVNTQRGRTFGGILRGENFVASGTSTGRYQATPFTAWNLRSRDARKNHHIELVSHIAQTPTLEAWREGLKRQIHKLPPLAAARAASRRWWHDFWNRSHLVIHPEKPDPKNRAWRIGRNYQLFRYQLACNAFGEYPTKFNGGQFTFDPSLAGKHPSLDPDWRAWGGGSFTAQNQRLVHWPMLKSGDHELVKPQLEFYLRALPSAIARVKTYYQHEGALFAEQLENFGLPISAGWGWPEPQAKKRQRGKEVPFGDPRIQGAFGPNSLVERGEQANAYVSYHYESQLEMSYLALEHHRFFGSDISRYLPLIRASVRFFDEHYQLRQKMRNGKPLDDQGKLVIFPSTSCETYRAAKNPTDLIAGLHACLDGLLALDDTLVSPSEKNDYRGFKQRLPEFSFGEIKGDRIIKPAEQWQKVQNFECPQFYPLFPFNRFALGRDDLEVFRNTWKHGTFRKDLVQSWHQNGIFFARMGMVQEAADFNTRKLDDSPRRFPTFWGPGHDWVPDHNWGGSGMIGLQEMLMQTIGDRIILLPAWPKDWDCDFKLHAPHRTIISAKVRQGKITDLTVTPKSRTVTILNDEKTSIEIK